MTEGNPEIYNLLCEQLSDFVGQCSDGIVDRHRDLLRSIQIILYTVIVLLLVNITIQMFTNIALIRSVAIF